MFASPSLQVIKNLINEICGGSCDNLCFIVVDAMMSLPVVVDRLHPAHGGKTFRAQWTSEMMLRTILGQQRKHSPKNGSLYLPGTGDLFGPAIFNAVSRAVCASMMQVRDAVWQHVTAPSANSTRPCVVGQSRRSSGCFNTSRKQHYSTQLSRRRIKQVAVWNATVLCGTRLCVEG